MAAAAVGVHGKATGVVVTNAGVNGVAGVVVGATAEVGVAAVVVDAFSISKNS